MKIKFRNVPVLACCVLSVGLILANTRDLRANAKPIIVAQDSVMDAEAWGNKPIVVGIELDSQGEPKLGFRVISKGTNWSKQRNPNPPYGGWKLVDVGKGEKMIVSNNGSALDASHQGFQQVGVPYLSGSPDSRNGNQRWTLVPASQTSGHQYYLIVNKNIGGSGVATKALDANNGTSTPYLSSSFNIDNNNLLWRVEKASLSYSSKNRSTYSIIPKASDVCGGFCK